MKLYSVLFLILISLSVNSKVEPPNYNFSVDKFIPFMPGQLIEPLLKKQKATLISSTRDSKIYKFYIEHIRYRFALMVQVKDSKITDFHARLPHYFLHDIFHQSLINRYGPQDEYKKSEESALYLWKNKKNISHLYSGTCTITCFPIFYAAYLEKHDFGSKYKRLIEKLVGAEY